jgi:DNA-binding CsgD family transcriptional regulator
VSPAGCRELEARTASEYPSQLQRSGEGWPRLHQRHGVVFPLATALRDDRLAAEGVRGYVCALFVTAHDELAGWIEIRTTEPEHRVLAEIADPLRDVARSATRTLEVTLDLARSCGAVFPAPAPADDALSAREREIVTLVAEGLSDLNIATRLSICESTVGSHLRRVYRKLGVHSRVELLRHAERAHAG